MYLNLISQIGKLLNSEGDLMRSINMAMIMLQEYLPVRNPCLLIRDSIYNRYFINLAPEMSEEDKNAWNVGMAKANGISILKFQHKMILGPEEPDHLNLPCPKDMRNGYRAKIFLPVNYQRKSLPICIMTVMVTDIESLPDIERVLSVMADLIAVCMVARGVKVTRIKESFRHNPQTGEVLEHIVGQDIKLREIGEIVKRISTSKATVLIRGESGTGKELIAKAIHKNGLNPKSPFVGVNCAALSENLLESELFGHEKGAFTGAVGSKKGRFELANGGTLFLDEIGHTSLAFQAKILRVLQEGQFERLGGTRTIRVDVRVLCATNIDLESAITGGTFREDLFYRINVVSIQVPALRERREDIVLLARHFLEKLNSQSDKQIKLHPDDADRLTARNWPGNVRELENAIHSAFLMERDGWLHFEKGGGKELRAPVAENLQFASPPKPTGDVEREEMLAIENALTNAKGIQKRAAERLDISLRQLRYRIKKYGISVRKIRPDLSR